MKKIALISAALAALIPATSQAGESFFGQVQGAETLPEGAFELYEKVTFREDKGQGTYHGINYETELEYGVSNRLSASASFKMMSLDTSGLIIDGYLPQERDFSLKTQGIEGKLKYMFLSPALDDIGLSTIVSFDYDWLDVHSGQDKDTYSLELDTVAQKFFLEGELVWVGNVGMESTFADRAHIANLPEGFDWPTDPEMEIELKFGTGLTYRFAPGWFIGAEVFYETEFETEVGQERWSFFGGPSLHYASAGWWATASWLPQLSGGGEQYEGQIDTDLHLIEKTEQEFRFKVGFNF